MMGLMALFRSFRGMIGRVQAELIYRYLLVYFSVQRVYVQFHFFPPEKGVGHKKGVNCVVYV
jgi:hypothetical protein